MNSDFPRIITLLRKERNISQKNAASDLGVSQALLSHYEKGIRECGLEFLVKAADYYGVSCDYLLGRSPDPAGKTISYSDIPEAEGNVKTDGVMISFNKKLIVNSLNILFSLVQKTGSQTLIKETSNFIMLSIYRMFRVAYIANPRNDQLFFTVPEILASNGASAAMGISESIATAAARGISLPENDCADEDTSPLITSKTLSEEFPSYASSLLNLVKNSESRIHALNDTKK